MMASREKSVSTRAIDAGYGRSRVIDSRTFAVATGRCTMRKALRALLASCLALLLVPLFPSASDREGVPWRNEFALKYATGGYAVINGRIFWIGSGGRTTTSVISFVNRHTGLVHERYVFQRCFFEEVLYLSHDVPKDAAQLENARIVNPKDPRYPRFDREYRQRCTSIQALADRKHRFVERLKKFTWQNN
jgi:hypothetical protein